MVELISIEEIKQQCYLDEQDISEDFYLKSLSEAAIDLIETKISCKIYAVGAVPTGNVTGKEMKGIIKMCALMVIGYFYENRELHLSPEQERAFYFSIRDLREPQL